MGSMKMSVNLHSVLSSLAKNPAGSLQELAGYVADKKPLELLIDYHNFWARTVGMEALVVDRYEDISMDRLSELLNQMNEGSRYLWASRNTSARGNCYFPFQSCH